MLAYYNIDPANVVIEILETGVSDESQLVDAVNLYRSLGCKVAIDDFGVGFSNFDRLWRLRPDFVKIDRSIILEGCTIQDISSRIHDSLIGRKSAITRAQLKPQGYRLLLGDYSQTGLL